MADSSPLITEVSDTARWVAAYRAAESARPDALFHDPLADRLAGPRGRAIVGAAPRMMRNGWNLAVRTKLIDDLIAAAVGDGCDRVLNLAAGLDTRPYRLDLSAEFPWIEAELPELVAEKNSLLADEKPRCALTRYAVDLADADARAAFLEEALAGATKALVLTEGLLYYLHEPDVAGLAESLRRPEIGWWVMDVVNSRAMNGMNEHVGELISNAPWHFGPDDPLAYLAERGWQALEVHDQFAAAARLHRLPPSFKPFSDLPRPDPRERVADRLWSAVIRVTH
ncbi:class I SAM-dependent methyltransferase [Nocardia pseudobrasiliensis]|nr:SAM-dependent methyltransferase [Nocardia pseudobrasiliensis]